MFRNTTMQDALKSKTWWFGTISTVLEFAKMLFPTNVKVIAGVQAITLLMTALGLRDAVAGASSAPPAG